MIVVNGSTKRWHINGAGVLDACSATKVACPMGGDVVAADDVVDAHRAYEKYVLNAKDPAGDPLAQLFNKKARKSIERSAAAAGKSIGEYRALSGTYHVYAGRFQMHPAPTAAVSKARAAAKGRGVMSKVRSAHKVSPYLASSRAKRLMRKPATWGVAGVAALYAPVIAPLGAAAIAGSALVAVARNRGRVKGIMKAYWQ